MLQLLLWRQYWLWVRPPPVPAAFKASISICIKKVGNTVDLLWFSDTPEADRCTLWCVREFVSVVEIKTVLWQICSRRLYNFWIRESESSLSQQSYIQDKPKVDLMPQAPPECKFPARVGMNCMCVFSKRWKSMFFVTNAKNIYPQYLEKKTGSKGSLSGLKGLPVTDESDRLLKTEAPL